jgi:hypothetical protein
MKKDMLRAQEADMEKCMAECTLVNSTCPEPKKLQQLQSYDERMETARLPKNAKNAQWREVLSEVPPVSDQDFTRCEHAAERFVKLLFAIAHKPTKVRFDTVDPKTGKKLGSDDVAQLQTDLKGGSAPTPSADAGSGQVDKKAFRELYREKLASSLRTGPKGEIIEDQQEAQRGGTTPKW